MQRLTTILIASIASAACTEPEPGRDEIDPGMADSLPGLADLKQSFASIAEMAPALFDKAAAMKVLTVAQGQPITRQECEEILQKVRPNYKIDPNPKTYAWMMLCGDAPHPQLFARLDAPGTSNLGLPYAMVLQSEFPEHVQPGVPFGIRWFLDSNHRIVEKQYLDFREDGTIYGFTIGAIDAADNYYESEFSADTIYARTDVHGVETKQRFIAADGSTPDRGLQRTHVKHPTDPALDFTGVELTRADRRDWQDVQVLITLGTVSYAYDNDFHHRAAFRTAFFTRMRGSEEKCMAGLVHEATSFTWVPDELSYWTCSSYPWP
jgi:hypothetical protein